MKRGGRSLMVVAHWRGTFPLEGRQHYRNMSSLSLEHSNWSIVIYEEIARMLEYVVKNFTK